MLKIFKLVFLASFFSACEEEKSSAIATQVFCGSGETCEFDFLLTPHPQAALSANFLDEDNHLNQLLSENSYFKQDFYWEYVVEDSEDVLHLEVSNSSAYDYNIIMFWSYDELQPWQIEFK